MFADLSFTVGLMEAFAKLMQRTTNILRIMGPDNVFFKVMQVVHGLVQVAADRSIIAHVEIANMIKEWFFSFSGSLEEDPETRYTNLKNSLVYSHRQM